MSDAAQSLRSAQGAVDACWSRIGVRGDRSCPELKAHIHCRNCPAYSTAARILLDAPLAGDAQRDATRHFALTNKSLPDVLSQDGAREHSVMVFRLRAEWFALPVRLCLEVADMRPIHSLPHRRAGSVLGIVNVRGALLTCLSLADILGVASQPESKPAQRGANTPRLLVAKHEAGPVVFPVDYIQGLQRVREEDFGELPATLARAQARYTKALLSLNKKTVGLLDEQLLFHTVERSLA